MILSQTGRLIGFLPVSATPTPARRAFNVRVQTYQGKPVMTYFVGAVVSAHGQGHYLIYDENYHLVAQVHAGNGYQGDLHEFLLTDQGTALFTAYGEAVGTYPSGSRGKYFYGIVQEVDVASGKVLFQWRSDQHVPLADSYVPAPLNPANTWDYFHVNAITIDPTDNNLVISSRNTSTAYKVDRKTGRVIWKLGGKHSDFHMGPGSRFYFQHDVNLHPGGVVTIFDNEAGPPNMAKQSRGLVLQIDETNKTASVRTQFHHKPPVLSNALGSVQPLDKGHTFMGWGTSSYFTEYGPGQTVLFDGRLTPGTVSYRAFKQTWTGTPTTEAQPGRDAYRRRRHAVRQLELRHRGGRLGRARRPRRRSSRRRGGRQDRRLRDRDHAPAGARYVAVEAIDRKGAVLGKSKPLKL